MVSYPNNIGEDTNAEYYSQIHNYLDTTVGAIS